MCVCVGDLVGTTICSCVLVLAWAPQYVGVCVCVGACVCVGTCVGTTVRSCVSCVLVLLWAPEYVHVCLR